jgi:hypothetical protein
MFSSLLNPPNLDARTLRLTGQILLGFTLAGCAMACPIAKAHHTEFSTSVGIAWDLGQTVTVSYIPSIVFRGESPGPRLLNNGTEVSGPLSIDINLVTGEFSNARIIAVVKYPTSLGPIVNVSLNQPIALSTDSASWAAGIDVPFSQDGISGSLKAKTSGPFDLGAFGDLAANAQIDTSLDLPGGFSLNVEYAFGERNEFGVRALGISGELLFDGTSIDWGLSAPIEFFLNKGAAGDPPPPPPVPPIPEQPPVLFVPFYHTIETGYVYLGSGDLGSNTQEFSLASKTLVPSPLPMFGVAAALSSSRKLRKRIKHSRPVK